MTFETFDQSDEKIRPDQKIPTYLSTYLFHILKVCFKKLVTFLTFDQSDEVTDNWEPGFMTIVVTLQLIVTLDNIRNSCNV